MKYGVSVWVSGNKKRQGSLTCCPPTRQVSSSRTITELEAEPLPLQLA